MNHTRAYAARRHRDPARASQGRRVPPGAAYGSCRCRSANRPPGSSVRTPSRSAPDAPGSTRPCGVSRRAVAAWRSTGAGLTLQATHGLPQTPKGRGQRLSPRDRIRAVHQSGERLIQTHERRIEDDGLDLRHAFHRAWPATRQNVDLDVKLQPFQLHLGDPRLAATSCARAQAPHGPVIVTQPDCAGDAIAAEIIHPRVPAAPKRCNGAIWQHRPDRTTDCFVTRT